MATYSFPGYKLQLEKHDSLTVKFDDPVIVPITVTMTFHTHRTSPGVTCLSCGAKTNTAGELPYGH